MNLSLLPLLGLLVAASPSPQERLREAVSRLAESPLRAPGGAPLFPRDLQVISVAEGPDRLRIRLGGTWTLPADPAEAELVEELRLETLLGAMAAAELPAGVELEVPADRGYRVLGGISLPTPLTLEGPPPMVLPVPKLPLGAALAGKRIAISAGHGWVTSANGWDTQRSLWSFVGCGSCRGIVEDFYNAEVVDLHLVPLLQGMGAEVILVREPDNSTDPFQIADDGDSSCVPTGTWTAGSMAGAGYGSDYLVNAPGAGGKMTCTLANTKGLRHAYTRWVEGGNRTTDALLELTHAGGVTPFDFNQRLTGGFWLDLGKFWFGPSAIFTLSTPSTDGYLIADAVKVGGGIHSDSGKPWWQMAAKSYVPWAGASSTTLGNGDVTIRPRYLSEMRADALISFHGNATGITGGTATSGTSTYRYSCSSGGSPYADYSPSDSATNCDAPAGSKLLMDLVHPAMLRRLRADWDPNWRDKGRLVANFGELREVSGTTSNPGPSIPAILIESAFFDNLQNPAGNPPPRYPDNRSMQDPRFREAIAYGIAEGLAQYFDVNAGPPPPRPDGLRALNRGDGTLLVSWHPVAGATGYRLQILEDPGEDRARAWDAGRMVNDTQIVLGDLTPRKTYAFRVRAANADGEGLASAAVAARFRGAKLLDGVSAAEVLYVNAYDRRDAWVQERDNDLSYAVEHAAALTGADLFFDGALDEVVEDGTVPLAGYRLIDYAAGKDGTEHDAVSKPMQQRLKDALASGVALMASGEELAFDLGHNGDAADQAFLEQVLGATYLADDSGAHQMQGIAAGPFASLNVDLDDGTKGVYATSWPDVFGAATGATAVMNWPDGRAAAVWKDKVMTFGVGLEVVVPDASRIELFRRAIDTLAPGIVRGDLDLDGASDACEQQNGMDWRDAHDGAQGCPPKITPPVADAGTAEADAGGKPASRYGCGCTSAAGPSLGGWLVLLASLGARRRARCRWSVRRAPAPIKRLGDR